MKMSLFSRKGRNQNQDVPAEQSKSADTILKTYWVSLLSLMLCITMFFGTTVAWFSDDVSAPYNRIDVGSLQVKLEYRKPKDETYVNLVKQDNSNESEELIFDANVPWAPGYTAVREICVTNEGTLNLRYMFTFQDGKKTASDDLTVEWREELAKCFEVYVTRGSFDDFDDLPNSFNELVQKRNSDGTNVWTPVKNLNGNVANLQEIVSQKLTVDAATIKHNAESKNQSFLVALHMKEDSDIGVNGMKMPLGAYLLAYQDSTDTDDLGYTSPIVFVRNAAELKNAVTGTSNYTIVLGSNIEMTGTLTVLNNTQLDLNGHTLTLKAGNEGNGSLVVSPNRNLTVSDRSVVGPDSKGGEIKTDGTIDVLDSGTLVVNGGRLHNVQVATSTMIMNGGSVDEIESGKNGITLMGIATLELNYGYLKVEDSSKYFVFAKSGNCTVSIADTFHLFCGNTPVACSDAKFGKDSDAKLTVNKESIQAAPGT